MPNLQLQIEPTPDIVTIEGVQCRRWKGVTPNGIECEVFVHRVAVRKDLDSTAFERELFERLPPALPAVDFRHVL